MRPVHQVVAGVIVCSVTAAVVWACAGAGSQKRPNLPAIVECQLGALSVLPQDLGHVTVYDAIDIWERVHNCFQLHPDVDAGG